MSSTVRSIALNAAYACSPNPPAAGREVDVLPLERLRERDPALLSRPT